MCLLPSTVYQLWVPSESISNGKSTQKKGEEKNEKKGREKNNKLSAWLEKINNTTTRKSWKNKVKSQQQPNNNNGNLKQLHSTFGVGIILEMLLLVFFIHILFFFFIVSIFDC